MKIVLYCIDCFQENHLVQNRAAEKRAPLKPASRHIPGGISMGVVRGPSATKGSARSSSRIPGSGTTSSFQRFFSFSPGFDCLVANALCPKADSFSPPRCFDTNYMKRDTRRGPGISLRVEEEEEEERERTKGRLMLSSALLAPPLHCFLPVRGFSCRVSSSFL